MIIIFNILLLLVIHSENAFATIQLFSTDPDIIRNASQLIQSRGFESELHHPVTQDGYILTLVRLINPYIRGNRNHLKPIYLQHGLFGSSDNFLLSHREILIDDGLHDLNTLQLTDCTGLNRTAVGRSLAYVLATCGFDVWVGNFRGNRYSNKHILFDSAVDNDYWSFTMDHLSLYDITTNIEYILHQTKNSQLAYVGHSLGTSVMFQLLSYRPEYSRYVKPVIMLAPVAHVSHIRAPLLLLAAYNFPFINWLRKINMPIFGVPGQLLTIVDQLIGTFICGNELFRPLCTLFLFTLCGFDYPNTDQSLLPFSAGHFPDDTSARVLVHLSQRVVYDTFSFYDYGPAENLKIYSNQRAPIYNLSQINSEYLILISGINDWLADPDDVDIIRSQLTVKSYKDYVIPYELFNHGDFLIGNNVGKYQNSLILQWLHQIYQSDK